MEARIVEWNELGSTVSRVGFMTKSLYNGSKRLNEVLLI